MECFRLRPLSENDLDAVITAAGGSRAHEDADRRDMPGADYLLGETVVELKALDDEGLAKHERQSKLATLFRRPDSKRPVIVLDRERLLEPAQREYDRILEGPIKSAVRKARAQLKQSRAEHPSASSSVLFVVNNGYTALDHDALLRMVAHRARNDSKEIDGVVVAGCYFYSDGFDNYFLWPIDYIPLNLNHPFTSYDKLRTAWNDFAEQFMTSVVRDEIREGRIKGPVIDTQFNVDGVTFVKPAPPMGDSSTFFGSDRPRIDSAASDRETYVATTFPDITREEWELFCESASDDEFFFRTYDEWLAERADAAASGTALRPFVSVRITRDGWEAWRASQAPGGATTSVLEYSNDLFHQQIRSMVLAAREHTANCILPSHYMLAATELIGHDLANDVSHILEVREMSMSDPIIKEIVLHARIIHEHALALASAYALASGIDCVLWRKDLTYAWL